MEKEIIKTVDINELINILNSIEDIDESSWPVIFKQEGSDTINEIGLNEDGYLVWNEDNLGNLLTIHPEIWYNKRFKDTFKSYIDEGNIYILKGSFTAKLTERRC